MLRYIVSVFDTAAQTFGQPFFVARAEVARRSFADEINRNAPDNQLAAHPEDYELYMIGTFDDGEKYKGVNGVDEAELICRGKDVVLPKN